MKKKKTKATERTMVKPDFKKYPFTSICYLTFLNVNQKNIELEISKIGLDDFLNQPIIYEKTTGYIMLASELSTHYTKNAKYIDTTLKSLNQVYEEFYLSTAIIISKTERSNIEFSEFLEIISIAEEYELKVNTKEEIEKVCRKILQPEKVLLQVASIIMKIQLAIPIFINDVINPERSKELRKMERLYKQSNFSKKIYHLNLEKYKK